MPSVYAQNMSGFSLESAGGGAIYQKGQLISQNYTPKGSFVVGGRYHLYLTKRWEINAGLLGVYDQFQLDDLGFNVNPNEDQVYEVSATYLTMPLTLGFALTNRMVLQLGGQPEWKVRQTGIWLDEEQTWNFSWVTGVRYHLGYGVSASLQAQFGTTNLLHPEFTFPPELRDRLYITSRRVQLGLAWQLRKK